jgi:iron complex outermembrane receptor protein
MRQWAFAMRAIARRTPRTATGIFGAGTSSAIIHSSQSVATYLADARYHFSNNATGYLRYATGYRPGGPNPGAYDPLTGIAVGPPMFQSDQLRSYEAGFKSADCRPALCGRSRRLLYRLDQHPSPDSVSRRFRSLPSTPRSHHPGAELTLTAHPIDAFTITGALHIRTRAVGGGAEFRRRRRGAVAECAALHHALNADYQFGGGGLHPTIGPTLRYVADRTRASMPVLPFLSTSCPAIQRSIYASAWC